MSREELSAVGFSFVGENVQLSNKVSIYHPEKIRIGNNVRIDDFCILSGRLEIGNYVHIAVGTYLQGGREGIFMGDFTCLAQRCVVMSDSSDYSGKSMTNPTVPQEYVEVIYGAVYIRKHAIVGAGSIVFPGVEIAEGTSVGAMSLLTKNTEPWTIVAGIPAKTIKLRERQPLYYEKLIKEKK